MNFDKSILICNAFRSNKLHGVVTTGGHFIQNYHLEIKYFTKQSKSSTSVQIGFIDIRTNRWVLSCYHYHRLIPRTEFFLKRLKIWLFSLILANICKLFINFTKQMTFIIKQYYISNNINTKKLLRFLEKLGYLHVSTN